MGDVQGGGEGGAFLEQCYRQGRERMSSMADEAKEDLEEELNEVLSYMGKKSSQAHACLNLLVLRLWSMAVGSERGSYGSAWFQRASLTNHSCQPNCGVAFLPEGGLQLRAIRPISAGEELLIAYIDVFQATRFRREDLLTSFFFLCKCPRCRQAEAVECEKEMQALRCQDDSCRAAMSWVLTEQGCPRCGENMPASRGELMHLLSTAAKLYMAGRRHYREEQVEEAAVCLAHSLTIREQLLHATNVDLLMTWEAAARAFIATRQWSNAQHCLCSAIAARRRLAPACGYSLGTDPFEAALLLMDLARVLLEIQDPSGAREQLAAARQSVLLARGEGSDLLQEIAAIEAALPDRAGV
mmetsp:Transcript_15297/g.42785  ORF Transcript_15297/g.42785 Transcript_15297/m.42785 type:complete len:356 (-) Transcript_15297:137-1204(-)